jgi:hypothetical protein
MICRLLSLDVGNKKSTQSFVESPPVVQYVYKEMEYLGVTLTDQNSIQEEIKSRLKVGNACYHLV